MSAREIIRGQVMEKFASNDHIYKWNAVWDRTHDVGGPGRAGYQFHEGFDTENNSKTNIMTNHYIF